MQHRDIANRKHLVAEGILLCWLSIFFGGFYFILADCCDFLTYALGIDDYSLHHYWKRLHGGARLLQPRFSFGAQHLRAEQPQVGLVGLTKAEQIKRFGPPDSDMPNQPTTDKPDYFLDYDEYLLWDLDATTV